MKAILTKYHGPTNTRGQGDRCPRRREGEAVTLRIRLSPDYLDALATRLCVAVILACSVGLAFVLVRMVLRCG